MMNFPLLRTKLYKPAIPADHVKRTGMLERLEENRHLPLILVSAPAGYGKSTLISSWIEQDERRSAWVSLDESDNDLRQFMAYFVAAVQSLFPGAARDTLSLIKAPSLPPIQLLAVTLINELDQIGESFIVVFDDIHRIHKAEVHEFLDWIVKHPSRSMQLIMVGRRDPLIPIATLRARGLMAEFRMKDLRFTPDESAAFMKAATGYPVEKSLAAAITEKAEGWVTALRLATLALRGEQDPARKLLELEGTTRYVIDYLINEIMDKQPPGIREGLLSTSILDRFCAPLCDVLCAGKEMADGVETGGTGLIRWLRENNLFVISLDAEDRWFRYHHLFEDFLRRQLILERSRKEIASLHGNACTWFEKEGFTEEAIRHALSAETPERAALIVETHGLLEFEEDRWHVAGRWLEQLPDPVKQQHPKLLLMKARVLEAEFRLNDLVPVIQRVQTLFKNDPPRPMDRGELCFFQGISDFWQGQEHHGRPLLQKALGLIPENPPGYLRAHAELYFGLSTHVNGNMKEALAKLENSIEARSIRQGKIWEWLQFGLATVNLLGGDLPQAYRKGKLLFDSSTETRKPFIEAWGAYLLGLISFHWSDLTQAQRFFGLVAKNRYISHFRAATDSLVGLSLSCQHLGQQGEADRWIVEAREYARWTKDPGLLETANSGEARLALLRGTPGPAIRWQRTFARQPEASCMFFFLVQPTITECRVLIARGTDTGISEAAAKLDDLRRRTSAVHYTCQTIDIVVLQALAASLRKRHDEALDLLDQAIAMATRGEWIHPFLEAGPEIIELLEEYLQRKPSADHVRTILDASPGSHSSPTPPSSLTSTLTFRERDVLQLLSERLQTKEIADQLVIAPTTVKSHLKNIYQKLGVGRRRQAIDKARCLGLLKENSDQDSSFSR